MSSTVTRDMVEGRDTAAAVASLAGRARQSHFTENPQAFLEAHGSDRMQGEGKTASGSTNHKATGYARGSTPASHVGNGSHRRHRAHGRGWVAAGLKRRQIVKSKRVSMLQAQSPHSRTCGMHAAEEASAFPKTTANQ